MSHDDEIMLEPPKEERWVYLIHECSDPFEVIIPKSLREVWGLPAMRFKTQAGWRLWPHYSPESIEIVPDSEGNPAGFRVLV